MADPPSGVDEPWNARIEAEFLRLSIDNAKLYVQLQQVKGSISSTAACKELLEFVHASRAADPLLPGSKVANPFIKERRGSNVASSTSPPHTVRYPSPPGSPPLVVPMPQPKTCKMLLVGLRHSGKTTVIKQLKYLYDSWSREELKRFIPDILERCIVAAKASLRAAANSIKDPTLKEAIQRIEQMPSRASVWSSDLTATMRRIWADHTLQKAVLQATADEDDVYFLNNLERFAGDAFAPTFADVIRLHDKPHRRYVRTTSGSNSFLITRNTTGADISRLPLEVLVQVCRLLPYNDLVHLSLANTAMHRIISNTPLLWKYHFNIPVNHSSFADYVDWRRTFVAYFATHSAQRVSGVEESTYDVGEIHVSVTVIGSDQLYSCRKWTNFLENVDAMLFCVDMCTYDQVVPGSNGRSALHECIFLFESYLNSPWFVRTHCILLFNKRDKLLSKIAKGPSLSVCFPDYQGGKDPQAAIEFIQRKFMLAGRQKTSRRITTHVLSATDPQHVRTVFESIHGVLMRRPFLDMAPP